MTELGRLRTRDPASRDPAIQNFRVHSLGSSTGRSIVSSNYYVLPDGQRVLVNIGEPETASTTVVMNWKTTR